MGHLRTYVRRWIERKLAGMDDLEVQVFSIVASHQTRLTEQNRFVLNLPVLHEVFPHEPASEIYRVWKGLKETGLIEQDPMDGEWRIAGIGSK